MDHSTHTRLSPEELTATVLEDATIYGADDHKVGKVSHVHGAGMASQWLSTSADFSASAQNR